MLVQIQQEIANDPYYQQNFANDGPAKTVPSAEEVADAWIDRGSEEYFLNNVKHGIRTAGDGDIWKRIKERDPAWLRNAAYAEAIRLLNAEGAS
jgi:hypothetical protein